MSEIPEIQINTKQVRIINAPFIRAPEIPVSVPIGFPVIEMPCVETRRGNYENDALINNDPEGNVVLCPGGVPSFNAMDYTPEELIYTQSEQPQRYEEPEIPPSDEPPTSQKSEDCPPVDAPEVGTKIPDGKGQKEIVGYQLIGNRCVTQYEKVTLTEQIVDAIPSAPQVVTTTGITLVATSAALATPALLRVVKPLVKQIISRVKKALGRKEKELSVRERREKQRELTAAVRALKKMKK